MSKVRKENSNILVVISLASFILVPVISTQETASPEMPLVILAMLPAFVALALKIVKVENRGYGLPTMLLCASAFVSTLFSRYSEVDIRMLKYILFAVYFVLMSSIVFSEKNVKFVIYIYITASIVLAILIILSMIFGYPHVDSMFYQGRYSIGITGMYKNPNYITSFINIGYFFVLYKFVTDKKKYSQKMAQVIVLLTFIIAMYFSGTRAALLTAIITTILVFFTRRESNKILIIGSLFFAFAMAFFVYSENIAYLYDNFMGHRGSFEDVERAETWLFAFDKIIESPILGYGLFGWGNIPGTAKYMMFIHNIYIELLVSQGLWGILLFIYLFFNRIKKCTPDKKNFVYIFMFVNSFPLMFQNGFVEANFWRFMIINSVIVNYCEYAKSAMRKSIY